MTKQTIFLETPVFGRIFDIIIDDPYLMYVVERLCYSFTQFFYLGHYEQRVNYKEDIYVRTCLPPSLNNWELPKNVTNFCEKSAPHFFELFRAYVSK